MIKIAVSKGRIFKEIMPLLEKAGVVPADDPENTRKLILDTNHPDIQLVIVRASDVPTYVEYGAADLGVAGKDVLMEHDSDQLYEPIDLNIARCRLMVAGYADKPPPRNHLQVATKYVRCTERYFATKGVQVEIIKLYGSMELAPIVGLADCIVDVVDTGNTLRANGLTPLAHITDISSRLIVNKASMKMKHDRLKPLMQRIQSAVRQTEEQSATAA